MIIKSYGLFWRTDEVAWNPGRGKKGEFRLLGRRGLNSGSIEAADFRQQHGIYILYGNHGPYYVGLARARGLGPRLKEHLTDRHGGKWDRFSWFGFRKVLERRDMHGLCTLANLAEATMTNPKAVIGDIEALLIKAMGLSNISQMNFAAGECWTQIKKHEASKLLARL
jgi:hypothetical protein